MAIAYCPREGKFYCSECAGGAEEVAGAFWAWSYWFRYRSPWTEEWQPGLDRLEFEGRHPAQRVWKGRAEGSEGSEGSGGAEAKIRAAISSEPNLMRYPERPGQWRVAAELTDADVLASWNANAERWDAGYDDDGDRTRRYQSDEPMLALLGEVKGLHILDAGSGNGYLARKLAKAGAQLTAVEFSDRLHAIAAGREGEEPLGIRYHNASICVMPFLADGSVDKVVSNYVLMDVRDYEGAVGEIARVLKPGGVCVVVISHPCFSCGPGGWVKPALDSPRIEDEYAFRVDQYFHRGSLLAVWGNFDPVTGFHRPLRDYWQAFAAAGLAVEDFEEPSITELGKRELPPSRVIKSHRIPYSCIFKLRKRGV
jgi:SAM-dependent methyltransferase